MVDATLKEGARHIYKRRTFYLDEDSWQIVVVDAYDKRDQLWRVSEGHAMTYYNVPSVWTALEVHTDLQAGRYLAIGLNSENPAVRVRHQTLARGLHPGRAPSRGQTLSKRPVRRTGRHGPSAFFSTRPDEENGRWTHPSGIDAPPGSLIP